jgi:hypothetical protein
MPNARERGECSFSSGVERLNLHRALLSITCRLDVVKGVMGGLQGTRQFWNCFIQSINYR